MTGRLQTGKYTNKDGVITYTTDVVIEEMEFAESKKNSQDSDRSSDGGRTGKDADDDFMQIPDDIDGELPFD